MPAQLTLGAVAVAMTAAILIGARLRRHDDEVDSYHERQFQDPLTFDLPGGGY